MPVERFDVATPDHDAVVAAVAPLLPGATEYRDSVASVLDAGDLRVEADDTGITVVSTDAADPAAVAAVVAAVRGLAGQGPTDLGRPPAVHFGSPVTGRPADPPTPSPSPRPPAAPPPAAPSTTSRPPRRWWQFWRWFSG